MRRQTTLVLSLLCLVPLCFSAHAAEEKPGWWPDAELRAKKEGSGLLDHEELERILSREDVLLIDVRPDYEFETGHLPGAVNLEFDLGDRFDLSNEKQKVLLQLFGDDLERPIVIYCRSFR